MRHHQEMRSQQGNRPHNIIEELEKCEENNLDEKLNFRCISIYFMSSNAFNLLFDQPRSDTSSTSESGRNSESHTDNYKTAFDTQKRDRENH